MAIEVTVVIVADDHTLGAARELLREVDKFGVSEGFILDGPDDSLSVETLSQLRAWVDNNAALPSNTVLPGERWHVELVTQKTETIFCGEHVPAGNTDPTNLLVVLNPGCVHH